MPARKTPGIKKAIIQYVNGNRESISRYTIKSASGHIESFTLVIVPKNNVTKSNVTDQYVVFATNAPMSKIFWNLHTLPEEYRKRCAVDFEPLCMCRKHVCPSDNLVRINQFR